MQTMIAGYELLDELGSGGFGRVYRARHSELGERAIKIAIDPAYARYLRQEGRAVGRLHHPRIVAIHHMDVDHDPPYLVMEYLPGGDLRHLLSQGPLPVARAAQIMCDVLEALEYAHSHGVIHRDIKPGNILLDEEGRAKLSDFGLGRVVEETSRSWGRVESMRSGSGETTGTLRYMSPEQLDPGLLQDGPLDHRTDLYSLGLVFCEMLTGELPIGTAPEPPSEARPGVPPEFDAIFRTLTQGRRERRYQDAQKTAAALCVVWEVAEARREDSEPEAARQRAIQEHDRAAMELLEQGRYPEALAEWNRLLVPDPEHKSAKEGLAEARRQQQQMDDLAKEESRRGDRVVQYLREAKGYFEQGNHEAAISAWQQVLALESRQTEALEGVDRAREEAHATADAVRRRRANHAWIAVGLLCLVLVGMMLRQGGRHSARVAPPSGQGVEEEAENSGPSSSGPPRDVASGQTWVSPVDGKEMVYVPGGEFLMGSPAGEGESDERPQRRVYLEAFWMDQTEVTVAQYRRFCQATGRAMPAAPSWGWEEAHPIVKVTWNDAVAYAAWAGKRLPTDAEWEKAARGTEGRKYPWGDQQPDSQLCNYDGSRLERSTPVGSYPAGASPYGCLDMAGNVWEWCADWYYGSYYQSAPLRNPPGPVTGDFRSLRGGSWDYKARGVRCADRSHGVPTFRDDNRGFRCARTP